MATVTESGSSDVAEVQRLAAGIRALVLERTLAAGGGYLSQACSSADLFATLYGSVLELAPLPTALRPDPFRDVPGRPDANPPGDRFHGEPGPDTDRLLVSPAHYALTVYAALVAVGRLSPEALATFNADGSTLEMIGAEHSPGFALTTGSMGQALSQAAGISLARRLRGDAGTEWVMMGDGELQEGQVWEAVQFAAFHRLDRLRSIVDVNHQQVDGRTEDVIDNRELAAKFASFGAVVRTVDGHDVAALQEAAATSTGGLPLVILAETEPAHGMPALKARAPKLHYVRIRDDEERAALEADLEVLRARVKESTR
jgi:transketolase